MKILLTGHSGFLGGTLKKIFELDLHQVYPLTKSGQLIDITKPFSLNHNYNTVVHCAGKAHSYPKTEIEKQAFYDVNFQGTVNLLNALENCKIDQFIFISTIAVYGLETGNGITESYPLLSESPYGKSKIEAEKACLDWGETRGIKILIFRLPLVVGHNPTGNLGKMISSIRKGRYLSINHGMAKRSAVLAEDVAQAILRNPTSHGVYHLSDKTHPSFRDFENTICRQLKKKSPISIPLWLANIMGWLGDLIPGSPINTGFINRMTLDFTISCEKALSELDWEPKSVLDNFKLELSPKP
jgi:nucleoside-diphosphate-sugar epimerase